jgi:hypothetical protein
MKLEPQVEFVKEASQLQNMFWEYHDLTVQLVIAYIYLGGRIMHLAYLIFQTVL